MRYLWGFLAGFFGAADRYVVALGKRHGEADARLIVGQPGREGSRIVGRVWGLEGGQAVQMRHEGLETPREECKSPTSDITSPHDPLAEAIWQEIQLRNAHPNMTPEMRRAVLIRRRQEMNA